MQNTNPFACNRILCLHFAFFYKILVYFCDYRVKALFSFLFATFRPFSYKRFHGAPHFLYILSSNEFGFHNFGSIWKMLKFKKTLIFCHNQVQESLVLVSCKFKAHNAIFFIIKRQKLQKMFWHIVKVTMHSGYFF